MTHKSSGLLRLLFFAYKGDPEEIQSPIALVVDMIKGDPEEIQSPIALVVDMMDPAAEKWNV